MRAGFQKESNKKKSNYSSSSQKQQKDFDSKQINYFRSRQKDYQYIRKRRQQLFKNYQKREDQSLITSNHEKQKQSEYEKGKYFNKNQQNVEKKEQMLKQLIQKQNNIKINQENIQSQNNNEGIMSNQSLDIFADSIQEKVQKNNNNNNNNNLHINLHQNQNDQTKNHIKNELKQKQKQKQEQKQIFTDQSGYYNVIVGKIIGKKYKIVEKLGKGVFGNVIKVIKQQSQQSQPQQYAIKILRKNHITQQSGLRQFRLLNQISQNTKKNQSFILQVYDQVFYQEGHACFVCQLMGMDLRTYTHKNQNKIDLSIIREYSICMFMALHQMRKNKIIHADIKPDNFLLCLNKQKSKIRNIINGIETSIKLSDFGTSYRLQQHNMTDQLVARYYRAPEIVLGIQDLKQRQNLSSIDTWAVGCSLYQLYTGNFLFNPASNNELLKQIMQTRGKFSIKMLKKSQNFYTYFDDNYNFLYQYIDKNTKQIKIQKIQVSITAQRDLANLLKKHKRLSEGINIENKQQNKKLQFFRDLLEKCLILNPKDRITPKQALMHPFISYQIKLD